MQRWDILCWLLFGHLSQNHCHNFPNAVFDLLLKNTLGGLCSSLQHIKSHRRWNLAALFPCSFKPFLHDHSHVLECLFRRRAVGNAAWQFPHLRKIKPICFAP